MSPTSPRKAATPTATGAITPSLSRQPVGRSAGRMADTNLSSFRIPHPRSDGLAGDLLGADGYRRAVSGGSLLTLVETLPAERRSRGSFADIVRTYDSLLR